MLTPPPQLPISNVEIVSEASRVTVGLERPLKVISAESEAVEGTPRVPIRRVRPVPASRGVPPVPDVVTRRNRPRRQQCGSSDGRSDGQTLVPVRPRRFISSVHHFSHQPVDRTRGAPCNVPSRCGDGCRVAAADAGAARRSPQRGRLLTRAHGSFRARPVSNGFRLRVNPTLARSGTYPGDPT